MDAAMSATIRKLATSLVLLAALFVGLFSFPSPPRGEPCSAEWADSMWNFLDLHSDGHGPDANTREWFHGVESALRMQPPDSDDVKTHCLAVARYVGDHRFIRSRIFGFVIRWF
jgi:hypothetical protein